MQASMKGSVLTPGSVAKATLGEGPWTVEVDQIAQNEGDDCAFYRVVFPGAFVKNFQAFTPVKAEDIVHQLINLFSFKYGTNVELASALPVTIVVGTKITFKETV